MKEAPGLNDRIDRVDLNILAALYGQARMSKVQIGAKVGLSASRCYERMRRLEHAGVVRGYHADVDLARLVSSVQFFVQIKLLNYTSMRPQQFEKALMKIPEILSCQSVLGNIDYMLLIAAASVEKYQDVIAALRLQSGCEFDFVTFPITKTVKSPGDGDLRQLVSRLTLDKASAT